MVPYKYIAVAVIVAGIMAGTFAWGHRTATNKLQPIINDLNANLISIDLTAKRDTIKYEQNLDVIKTKNNSSVASIAAKYDSLLHAKNNTSPGTTPQDTQRTDATPAESALIEFERACALDANQVTLFQDWIRLNNIPIAE